MTAIDTGPKAQPVPPPGDADPHDARLAQGAIGLLRVFNQAGVLAAADVHVATRLAALAGGADDDVLLAVALAVRAPRLGHVCADLTTARHSVTADAAMPVDLQALPWPSAAAWIEAVAANSLVAVGGSGPDDRPLRLEGSRLYLDRYWRQERAVAAHLRSRAAQAAAGVDLQVLAAGLDRLDPAPGATGPPGAGGPPGNTATGLTGAGGPGTASDGPDLQRLAAASAVLRRLSVVAGGPGTGKTTTVAR
ncbi:MAG: exodeoxyribonuclease V subunit alpha, partial [Acidimicrobiales bacterium]